MTEGEIGRSGSTLPESRAAPVPMPSFLGGGSPGGGGAAAGPDPGSPPSWWASFKAAVKSLKREVLALHYAIQDPRVGVLPRLVGLLALAYVLSPIDLIPDFIPVLGLLDDLIILPALLLLARWLIPDAVLAAARQRAEREPLRLHKNWGMALVFFAIWDALLLGLVWWACTHFGGAGPMQQYKAWIVGGCGAALALAELGWAVARWRREARMGAVLRAAGTEPQLQEALLRRGGQAVQDYLEP